MRASHFILSNLQGYFCGVLEIKTQPSRVRSHTQIQVEGEVITADEFVEFLEKKKGGKDILYILDQLYLNVSILIQI